MGRIHVGTISLDLGGIRNELVVGSEVGCERKSRSLEWVRRPKLHVERDLCVRLLKLLLHETTETPGLENVMKACVDTKCSASRDGGRTVLELIDDHHFGRALISVNDVGAVEVCNLLMQVVGTD